MGGIIGLERCARGVSSAGEDREPLVEVLHRPPGLLALPGGGALLDESREALTEICAGDCFGHGRL